jgi:hypothetical protein
MISAGEFVQAIGCWINDRAHGAQFRGGCGNHRHHSWSRQDHRTRDLPLRIRPSEREDLQSFGSWEWLEDPGFPIPPEITNITGIAGEMIAGRRIDDHAVDDRLDRVVLVIATTRISIVDSWRNNFPPSRQNIGACSRSDIDWRAEGIRSSARSKRQGEP